MEDGTDTTKAANEHINDPLEKSLACFKETISATELFTLDDLKMERSDRVGTVTIPLTRQHMTEDLLQTLTGLLHVNILYSYKDKNGRFWRTVTYSTPYHNEMYIIGMESEIYGITEEVTVTFFDTIDIMLTWLRDNLQSIGTAEKIFMQRQKLTELCRIFM